jgi:hypothetical protein
MSESLWEYIEERIGILILIDLEGWDFSGDDASEESGHSVE